MRFYHRHPYLIWQLIGWGMLAAAFGYMMFHLDGLTYDYQYMLFVFPSIFGTMIVTVSPFLILLVRKGKSHKDEDRWIFELHSKQHPLSEVLAATATILIFLVTSILIARFGYFFLFPIAVLAAGIPYVIFRHTVRKRFYQISHAERLCLLYRITDPRGLALFEQTPTLVFHGLISDEKNLNFIYNFYRQCGALRYQKLRLFLVHTDLINARYGCLLPNVSGTVVCVSAQDIVINEQSILCYRDHLSLYEPWIGNLISLREMSIK